MNANLIITERGAKAVIEYKYVLPGCPVTKKNSQQIAHKKVNGKTVAFILPSKRYREYEKAMGQYIKERPKISAPCNVKCEYFMPTRRKVDLSNLQEATLDIMVRYGVIEDDNSDIVMGHDGSRVYKPDENPRAEITITVETEDG